MTKKLTALLLASILLVTVVSAGCAKKETAPQATRTLVAVGEATFAPFEYVDEKTGKPTGFDVELIQAIGEASGFKVQYKNIDWNSLIPALLNKEADLIVSGMTITDERALQVAFSDPYFTSGQAWAVKEGSPIKTINDLAGKTVGVQLNTTGDFAAEKLAAKFKEENKAELKIKKLRLAADIFNELKAGGVDAIIADLPVIKEYIKNNPQDKIVVPEPAFTVEYFGIAMRKQDTEIIDLVNKGLAKIKASGKYDEIYNKYFGKK